MRNRTTFVIAGLLLGTGTTAQYFLTVEELTRMGDEALGKNLTVSGAVLGDTIVYDAMGPSVTFTVVHVPGDPQEVEQAGGLAQVLHEATLDTGRPQLEIVYDSVKPDLLQHEAQAIVRGRLAPDGRFLADDLLLKCPTRYEEDVPGQTGD